MTNTELAIAVLHKFRNLIEENAALIGILGNLRLNNEPLDWPQMLRDILKHHDFQEKVHGKYDPLEQSILRSTDEQPARVLLTGLMEI